LNHAIVYASTQTALLMSSGRSSTVTEVSAPTKVKALTPVEGHQGFLFRAFAPVFVASVNSRRGALRLRPRIY
jgi:hypothetical protein